MRDIRYLLIYLFLCSVLGLGVFLGCNNRTHVGAGDGVSVGSLTSDANAQQQSSAKFHKVSLDLVSPERTQIIQGKMTHMTFQLRDGSESESKQWVVVNYGFLGGRVRDNTSSKYLAGELLVAETLIRPNNVFVATARDVTGCKNHGYTQEQCLGKYTIRPLGDGLEIDIMSTVGAKLPPDGEEVGAGAVDREACMSDAECKKRLVAAARELAEVACSGIDPKNMDFRVLDSFKWAESTKVMEGFMQNPGQGWKRWVRAGLSALIMSDVQSKDENNETKAQKKAMQEMYQECWNTFTEKYDEE